MTTSGVARTLIRRFFRQTQPSEAEIANILAARAMLPSIEALDCAAILMLSAEYDRLSGPTRVRQWPEKALATTRRTAKDLAYEASSLVEDTIWECGHRSEILWVDSTWGPALRAVFDAVLACAAADLIPRHVREDMAAPLSVVIPDLPFLTTR